MNQVQERVSTEIRNLLAKLNDDNYDSVVRDLSQYFDKETEESMAKAIEELVSAIVQKTVSIATQTAIELALKDCTNEDSLHNESSIMVVFLAANLSHATCKEPLCNLISTHLRDSVKSFDIPSELVEDVIKRLTDKYLQFGCASIEKHATEKGLVMVKKELTQLLSNRKKRQESSRSFSKTIERSYTTSNAVGKIYVLQKKLEAFIANDATETQKQSVISEVHAVMLKCICKDEAALAMAENVFEGLYENTSSTASIESRLTILATICDANKLVGKKLTGWVLRTNDRKFHKDVTVGLIKRRLLNVPEYSYHIAWLINAGKNGTAKDFAISLLKTLESSDAAVMPELHDVTDALAKATYSTPVERNDDNLALTSSELNYLYEHVYMLLLEWCHMSSQPDVSEAVCAHYVAKVHQTVLSKSDDMPSWFFYNLLEFVASNYRTYVITTSPLQSLQQKGASSFHYFDIYADLVFSVLKFCPVDHNSNKLSLFTKALSGIVEFITNDANKMKTAFDPKSYFHLFIDFFTRISIMNSVIDGADFQALAALSLAFHSLRPAKVPEFSFAWVELITIEYFMRTLLNEDDQKGWPYFHRLVIDLLQFMEPFLRSGVKVLCSTTVTVLAVLSHDFPGFTQHYYASLCEAIPAQCNGLRDIILSAFGNRRPEQPQLDQGQSAGLK